MFYEAPQSKFSSRNFNRCISFDDSEDAIKELGIERTHQDSDSRDILICNIFSKTKSLSKKFRDEIRRITLSDETCYSDDEYALLMWEGGRWIHEAKRWHWNMLFFAYRSGYNFS